MKLYNEKVPLFTRFQIESQIETAFQREVRLPSGGALVLDHTEALLSIDINSARATKGGDIEETALMTNREAAEEVARQLRLRDLGGLIVIDFIDMLSSRNQREVENTLREALKMDRARVQVGRISRFGLLEMSRQRLRPSLGESSQIVCPRCQGQGTIRGTESLSLAILRIIEEDAMKEQTAKIVVQLPINVATYLLNEKRQVLRDIEQRQNISVILVPNASFETPHYEIERVRVADLAHSNGKQSSYELAVEREEAPESMAETQNAPVEGPAVKSLVPAQPAPIRTEKQGGFFKRLFSGLFSADETPKSSSNEKDRKQQNRGTTARRQQRGANNRPNNSRPSSSRKRPQKRKPEGNRKRGGSGGDYKNQDQNTVAADANASSTLPQAKSSTGNEQQQRDNVRDSSSDNSRDSSRDNSRDNPRDNNNRDNRADSRGGDKQQRGERGESSSGRRRGKRGGRRRRRENETPQPNVTADGNPDSNNGNDSSTNATVGNSSPANDVARSSTPGYSQSDSGSQSQQQDNVRSNIAAEQSAQPSTGQVSNNNARNSNRSESDGNRQPITEPAQSQISSEPKSVENQSAPASGNQSYGYPQGSSNETQQQRDSSASHTSSQTTDSRDTGSNATSSENVSRSPDITSSTASNHDTSSENKSIPQKAPTSTITEVIPGVYRETPSNPPVNSSSGNRDNDNRENNGNREDSSPRNSFRESVRETTTAPAQQVNQGSSSSSVPAAPQQEQSSSGNRDASASPSFSSSSNSNPGWNSQGSGNQNAPVTDAPSTTSHNSGDTSSSTSDKNSTDDNNDSKDNLYKSTNS